MDERGEVRRRRRAAAQRAGRPQIVRTRPTQLHQTERSVSGRYVYPHALVAPYRWVALIKEALEAGADKVIGEGRATGDTGLYRPNGEPREGLIDEVLHELHAERLIFEAPQKHQQVWFIEHIGPSVNLGNVMPADAIPLETLRLGLRADTLKLFHGDAG